MANWTQFDKDDKCSFCRHERKDHKIVGLQPKIEYHCPDFSIPDINRDDDPWDPPSSTQPSVLEKLFDRYA